MQCNALLQCNAMQSNGGETSFSNIFMTQSSGRVNTDRIMRFSPFKFGTTQLQLHYSPKKTIADVSLHSPTFFAQNDLNVF